MSSKKKKNSKKPSLEDIVNKLSSLAKSQQEEKGHPHKCHQVC